MIINEDEPVVEQPENFTRQLYPFQLSTINMMEKYEKHKIQIPTGKLYVKSGILANKTGSGKSIVLLGLIKRNKIKESGVVTYYESCGSTINSSIIKTKEQASNYSQSLLIVLHSLKNQWKEELKYTDLTYYIIDNRKSLKFYKENIDQMEIFDIILLTDTFYNYFKIEMFGIDKKWLRIIYDELDNSKYIKDIDYINCNKNNLFVWFSSATLNMFNCKVHDTFSGMDLNYVILQCDEDYINARYIVEKHIIRCKTPKDLKILTPYISNDIYSLLSAGDKIEAIKRLNGNVQSDKNILEVFRERNNIQKIDLQNQIIYIKGLLSLDETSKANKIIKIENDITRIETILNSLEERIKNIESETCSICLDFYNKPVLLDCCKQIFCLHCLLGSLKNKNNCVLCRKIISTKDFTLISEENDKESKEMIEYTKDEMCLKIIENNTSGKFLIFSEREVSFSHIKEVLQKKNIKCKELKGKSSTLMNIIQDYNNGIHNVIFINATTKSSGFNIEKTTDIIIYHKVDQDTETQILGRALRINREKNLKLNVHYLLYDGEY